VWDFRRPCPWNRQEEKAPECGREMAAEDMVALGQAYKEGRSVNHKKKERIRYPAASDTKLTVYPTQKKGSSGNNVKTLGK